MKHIVGLGIRDLGATSNRHREIIPLSQPPDSPQPAEASPQTVSVSPPREAPENSSELREAIRRLIATQKQREFRVDGRDEERILLSQSVKIRLEDQQEISVLSQDLSPSGIGLVSTRSLLGRKLRLILPTETPDCPTITIIVRILWSYAVTEDLYKNGGLFLELVK
ncbi:MAG: PilZ domain-containing protein [Gemmataceae bacterium]